MLLRLLILALLIAAVAWVLTRRGRMAAGGRSGTPSGGVRPLVQDPVCKTFVPKETAIVVRRGDEDFYFCSRECAERFERREH